MKRFPLLLTLPLLLSSCSKVNYLGTYEFRLGKTDGSHIAVSARVTDEYHDEEKNQKKLYLNADLGDELSITAFLDKYAEKYPAIAVFIEELKKMIEDIKEIEFYYTILDLYNEKYGNRLALGSAFLADIIKKSFPELIDIIGEAATDITPEMVRYVLVAYINEKNLTFQIPVSMDDIKMQLCWYGTYMDENYDFHTLPMDDLPGEKGEARFGTHPSVIKDEKGDITYSEVDKVNELFGPLFSNMHLYTLDEHELEHTVGNFIYNEGDGLYFYYKEDIEPASNSLNGYIYINSGFGEFDQKVNLNFTVDPETYKTSLRSNEKEGIYEGFLDDNDTEVKYNVFLRDPFVFRDYHDVKISLAKI